MINYEIDLPHSATAEIKKILSNRIKMRQGILKTSDKELKISTKVKAKRKNFFGWESCVLKLLKTSGFHSKTECDII